MSIQFSRLAASGTLLLLCQAGLLFGQMTVTGSIAGTVLDTTGKAVAGAKITTVSEKNGTVRSSAANESGAFSMVALDPDVYSLKIEHPGFKAFERTGIVVTANEHIALGDVTLQVGAVTETITVAEKSAHVETDTAESSAELTTDQISNLTARGRDVVSMLRTIPGVSYQADPGLGWRPVWNQFAIDPRRQREHEYPIGGRRGQQRHGDAERVLQRHHMDAIGEVKVVLNSYRAEYAGNGGTVVTIVSKSGGSEYHGSGYWYLRNEDLNANDFINNRNGVKRPEYRYNTFGFSLGGPIYIPRVFNRDRRKLFGFYNLEQLTDRIPGGLTQYMMPTALERTGNFSQTVDTTGKVIPVNDPLNNKTPFPGNIVPANRLDSNGLALLKILPLPNFVNPAITGNTYNYQIQEVQIFPKRSQLFKIDYVRRKKTDSGCGGRWLSHAGRIRGCSRRQTHRVLRPMLLLLRGGDCNGLDAYLFADHGE